MESQGRRAFVQLVAVLLVSGGLRWAVQGRGSGESPLPGASVSPAVVADSVESLLEAESRRSAPLGRDERLDPNQASEETLDRLPGVGPSTAAAIVSARESLPFRDLDDLLRVRGLGPSTLEKLRPHLSMTQLPGGRRAPSAGPRRTRASPPPAVLRSGKGSLNPNRASLEELQSLPGIGPVLAERIHRWRDENGPFSGESDFLQVPGIGPKLMDRIRGQLRFR